MARTFETLVILVGALVLVHAQVDSVSISCAGSTCASECASFCTEMTAFDPTPGAYSDVTASASNGFLIVCNTQAEVDLITAAMVSHISGPPGVLVVCNGENWLINDDCGPSCPDGVHRTITINAGDGCSCDSAADDFSMRPCLGGNWGGAGGPTCNSPPLTLSVSATLTVSGGGGDPHMFAPNLPRYFELHTVLASTGRAVGDLSVTLMDMEGTSLVGEIHAQPGTEKYYFTSFRLSNAEETVEISFEAHDGRAHAVVQAEGTTFSCQDNADRVVSFSDASIRLQCTDVEELAANTTLMSTRFSHHIPFVQTGVLLAGPAYAVEFFFVQKDTTTPEFGFFDFQVSHSPSVDVGGVLANAIDDSRDVERSNLTPEEEMLAESRRLLTFLDRNISAL